MLKTKLLKAGFEAIHRTGAARVLSRYWGGAGVIFCLHHVTPGGGLQQGFAPNSNLEITPEFLAEIIQLVKRKGYDLVSIDEAMLRLRSGSSTKRIAVFTLDDGYRDNLIHAMPVFKAHQCPFTVYVAPRIADGTCELWWRILEAVIARVPTVKFGSTLLQTNTEAEKWQAWKRCAPILQAMPEYVQRDFTQKLADAHGIDWQLLCRKAAMTWDELRTMSGEPLATIGAHTLNHYNLLKLDAQQAKREIVESGQRVAAELNRSVQHFAYPYGNKDAAGLREFKLAHEAGYTSAVVTRLGPLQIAHANHPHALPRVMVSGRYQDIRYIETLMSGVPSRLSNRLSAINVS